MIFFNCEIKNLTKESSEYKHICTTFIDLQKQLNIQKNKLNNLTLFITKLTDTNIENYLNVEFSFLDIIIDLKTCLENTQNNIEEITNLLNELNKIISFIENPLNDTNINLSNYYILYMTKQNSIFQNDLKTEKLFQKIYKMYNWTEILDFHTNTIISNDNSKNQENNISLSLIQNIQDNNNLIISEVQNKVFLPYFVSEIEQKLQKHPKKYSSLQEIINKEYIVPLSKYKNPAISRFREAFNLMLKKEKTSITRCIDLGLELAFNYKLNPAIITACKDLYELDTYLDCLDDDNLDNFKIFNVKYEVLPI